MRSIPLFRLSPGGRLSLAVMVGASSLALMTPVSASAAESGSWTYVSPQECTFNKGETNRSSADRNVAFGKSEVQAWKASAAGSCRQMNRLPAGFLLASADLYKWNDQLRVWQLCRTTGRVTNSAPGDRLEATIRITADLMPCGNGWYGTVAGGWQYSPLKGAWVGGSVWSGYQRFAPAAESEAPPSPAWVGADGVVDSGTGTAAVTG
ncbi:hypothetical protein [Streptomyces sp. NPDC059828]|uniref:hypothetical protein n=1 Tax=Streptomyces sp. NPDC059828 TaxID=3346965 RepID=UPI00365BBD89